MVGTVLTGISPDFPGKSGETLKVSDHFSTLLRFRCIDFAKTEERIRGKSYDAGIFRVREFPELLQTIFPRKLLLNDAASILARI